MLWIVNVLFPEVQQLLLGCSDSRTSGGWLYSLADRMVRQPDLELYVAASSPKVKELVFLKGGSINYYVFPYCDRIDKYIPYMRDIKDRVSPDITNIHGTELPYGFAFVKACGAHNVVVTIQGLISEIAKYYKAGLTNWEIIRDITVRDILRHSILGEKRDFQKRGYLEDELLKRVKHVIGRTDFDKSHVLSMNPSVSYYYCSEALRDEFYTGHWVKENCIPHSIFLSQAWYPIKGAHMLFRALPSLISKYPDLKVIISGPDMIGAKSISQRLREHGYSKILKRYINKLSIENNVCFVGPLSALAMKEQLLRANVFVCPSSIENSSNSLCEAQMLGVPCVASYVGGLPSLVDDGNCYMYRFEDIEMLSFMIERCFNWEQIPSEDDVMKVHHRHNLDSIANTTYQIYKSIIS